ncbi:MAG: porin family protein [Hyphomicrobiales bacterium]|nr:MAG: porin family protein [Hyphomicrobiales bacterium]
MRKFLIGALAAAASLTATALPAAAQSPNFNGFYIGANVGAAHVNDSVFFNNAGTRVEEFGKGALAGGQIGYNYQISRFLLGVETSYDWSKLQGDTSCPSASFRCSVDSRDLFLATGRLGFVFGSTLAYAKGGYASADIKNAATPLTGGFSDSARRDGIAFGGGLEWKFSSNMTFGVDYTHVDFANTTLNGSLNGPTVSHPRIDAVTARINFLFGGREEYRQLK